MKTESKESQNKVQAQGLHDELRKAHKASNDLERRFKATVAQHEEAMKRRLQDRRFCFLLAFFWGMVFWCKSWGARFLLLSFILFRYILIYTYLYLYICYSIIKCAKRAWSVDCKQVVVKFTWINCGRSLRQSAQEFEKEKRFMKEQHKRGAWCEIHSTPKPQASVGTVKRCETEW